MINFRKTLSYGFAFSAAWAMLMAATPSDAQTANSQSGSNSAAGASSQSGSGAAAIINQSTTNSVPANTTNTTNFNSNERVSGGTNNTNTNQGHTTSDVTVRTTPTVYSPSVSGGNPCTLSASGGVSVIGWGAAAGGTWVDEECATRQKIALVHNSGRHDVAFELMCNDRATYNAVKMTRGQQCAWRSQFEPQGSQPPMAAQQPVPPPMPVPVVAPMAAKVYPRCNPRAGIVDNCQS
jgi:hypothetical protein